MSGFEFENEGVRRKPVYLLLDCSSSMHGAAIEAVNQGVNLLLSKLADDPASDVLWLSVIAFGGEATQVIPLTELTDVIMPPLAASGSTPMGEALRLLAAAIDTELVKNSSTTRGDYRPLVFLFTDGRPTDKYKEAAATLRQRGQKIIALAAGPEADTASLKEITDTVLVLRDATPENLQQYFEWMTASLRTVSRSAAAGGGEVALPGTPQVITVQV